MKKYQLKQLWLPVLIWVVISIGSISSVEVIPLTHTRYACDTPDFCQTNRYSIECAVNERIAMNGVSYGAKPYTNVCPKTQACVTRRSCCHYNAGDCLVPFNETELAEVYSKCSGLVQCGWFFVKSVELQGDCRVREKTNYVWAEFGCVNENNFIDICSQQSVTADAVHIHHSAISSTYNYDQCSCIITPAACNTSARLQFRAVDVRLHNIQNNLTTCSPNSRLELIGQREMKAYHCEKDKFLHGYKTFHISGENNMALYLHKKHQLYPQNVWLEAKATISDVKIRVTCGPRSVETAPRCPALPINQPDNVDEVEEVPDRPDNTPTIIHITPDGRHPANNVTNDDRRENQDPVAAVIGGIVAGIVVLILLLVLFCFIWRKRKQNKEKQALPNNKTSLPYSAADHQVNYYETVNDSDGKPVIVHPMDNEYHQPWEHAHSRAKPVDLAYATSEEIKVLIEKMEKDRQSIVEGNEPQVPCPDPTYYRHVSTFTFKPHDAPDCGVQEEERCDVRNRKESETESVASDNCGTEKLESEDSKVEADRGLDSDHDSHKVESETVSAYYDGYESPRVSSFQPSDISESVRSSVRSDGQSELHNYVYQPDDVVFDDIDIPDEHAPPISAVVDNQSKDSTVSCDQEEREVTLGAYRKPRGSVDLDNVKLTDLDEDQTDEAHYTSVYDEINDVTAL